MLALQRTLSTNGLLDIMPETNYKAAVQVINRWEKEFPETYKKLKTELDMPVKQFAEALQNFDTEAYERFEKIYPSLTAGSVFNPFLGFDVVDLYEEAVRGLAQNERTLFTFISAPGVSTLPAFLETYEDDHFELITPDLIYDYFEPLFKKEVYGGSIHENYVLTEMILDKLSEGSLESNSIATGKVIYYNISTINRYSE